MRIASLLLLAFLTLGASKCEIVLPNPQPSPSPTPTAEPTPVPTPEPTPIPTPEPTPEPVPSPTPQVCTAPLNGTPEMGAYKLYPRVIDATPRIINAERCTAVGYPGRIKCPVVPDEHPQRSVCETALMGSDRPVWELQSDTLRWSYEDEWKARIIGNGTGRIRACYANGKACSPWVELSY